MKWLLRFFRSEQRQRIELEQERILVTSQLMTVARQALEVERERLQTQAENQLILHTIHQLTTEAWIDISTRLDHHPAFEHETLELDRRKVLTRTLSILYRREQLLKEKEAQLGIEFHSSDKIELQDVQHQIQKYEIELENK